MTPPPIIIIHRGDSPYLAYTIAQARESNPNSRIILLGDRSNSFYLGVEHHYYQDYFAEAEQFSKLFSYEHFPNYQYSWILFCHQKYFFLRDFCKKKNIISFLLIDSDVMIYEGIKYYFDYYSRSMMTLICNGDGICAQAGFSIINDSTAIDKLCDTYTKMFSKPIETLKKEYNAALFTEMVGLKTLLASEPNSVVNTYHKTKDGFIFNYSMEADPRFDYEKKLLLIKWENKIPFLKEGSTKFLVKTPFLHFHGKGKYVMRKYLKIKRTEVIFQMIFNRLTSALLKYPKRLINKVFGASLFPKI
jgi:hypothetical protein